MGPSFFSASTRKTLRNKTIVFLYGCSTGYISSPLRIKRRAKLEMLSSRKHKLLLTPKKAEVGLLIQSRDIDKIFKTVSKSTNKRAGIEWCERPPSPSPSPSSPTPPPPHGLKRSGRQKKKHIRPTKCKHMKRYNQRSDQLFLF